MQLVATETFAAISRKLGKRYQEQIEAFQTWIFWLKELWGSRHSASISTQNTMTVEAGNAILVLINFHHIILSFHLLLNSSWSLVSFLCPVRQLTILTCLYQSHTPLAHWMLLFDQLFVCFSPLLSSFFILISIISVCYHTKCKHQGL